MYDQVMKEMVRDVLHGENRLLYTYGVTNSGKTYTIQGKTHTYRYNEFNVITRVDMMIGVDSSMLLNDRVLCVPVQAQQVKLVYSLEL